MLFDGSPGAQSHRHRFLLGYFLLVGDGFPLPFARAAVVLGLLSADGQSEPVAHTAVATDIHQPLDVELHFGTKRSLHLHVVVDERTDAGQFIVVPFLDLFVQVNIILRQDPLGGIPSYAEDVGKAYLTPFVFW
jgi:hypothetical protein